MNPFSAVWIWPLFLSLILGSPLPATFNVPNLQRRDELPTLQNTVAVLAKLSPRAPSPDEPSSTPTSTTLTVTYPTDPQPITQAPIGAIFGGVMGGVLLVIACAMVFSFMRKRWRQKQTQLTKPTQLAPTTIPKPQPSVHVEEIDDTAPGTMSPNGYSINQGSGNHTNRAPLRTSNNEAHKTDAFPLADNGIMGLEITSRKGVRNAIGAQAR
jgi:hypothetical protein